MPKTTKTFERFNLVRRLSREMFVNGYREYGDYMDTLLARERRYSDRAALIQNCLYDSMRWPEKGRKWMSYDQMRIESNPLNRLYQANKMRNTFHYALYFALCDLLRDGRALSQAGLMRELEERYDLVTRTDTSKVTPHLERYLEIGLLRRDADGRYRLGEWLAVDARRGTGLFDRYPRLADAVAFFSERSALGIVGSQIMDLCDFRNELFLFKHKYIAQVLDAIALSDVLEAIQNRSLVRVREEQISSGAAAEFTALPIKLLSSAQDGRQYIYIFDMQEKRYRSIRLDYIEDIKDIEDIEDGRPGKISRSDFEAACGPVDQLFREGEARLRDMWGVSIRKQTFHVSVRFQYDPHKEGYIGARIRRELRGKATCVEEPPGSGHLRLECDVCDPGEMTPWLLKQTGYIQSIRADDVNQTHRLESRFRRHIVNEYDLYHARTKAAERERYRLLPPAEGLEASGKALPSELDEGFRALAAMLRVRLEGGPETVTKSEILKQIGFCIRKSGFEEALFEAMLRSGMFQRTVEHKGFSPISEEKLSEWRRCEDNSELFSGVNSCYVYVYRHVLRALREPAPRRQIQALISDALRRYGFEDSHLDISFDSMLKGGMLWESEKDGLYSAYLHLPSDEPHRPLVKLELRWLRAILDEPQIGLFLDPEELERLRGELAGFVPLYRPEDIAYYDAYTDGDDCAEEGYIANFRALCRVLRAGGGPVRLRYVPERGGETEQCAPVECTLMPLRLEYSRRDDRFQLLAYPVSDGAEMLPEGLDVSQSGLVTLRLSGIRGIEEAPQVEAGPPRQWSEFADAELCEEPIEVRVASRHAARERFMIALMPYRKEVRYRPEADECVVRIWYIQDDQKELLAALHSYGDALEVLGPKSVRTKVVRQINRQYDLLFPEERQQSRQDTKQSKDDEAQR